MGALLQIHFHHPPSPPPSASILSFQTHWLSSSCCFSAWSRQSRHFHTQVCSFLPVCSVTSFPSGPVCTFGSGRQRPAGSDGHQNPIGVGLKYRFLTPTVAIWISGPGVGPNSALSAGITGDLSPGGHPPSEASSRAAKPQGATHPARRLKPPFSYPALGSVDKQAG